MTAAVLLLLLPLGLPVFTLEKVLAPPVAHSEHMVCDKRAEEHAKVAPVNNIRSISIAHNDIQECYCFGDNYDKGCKRYVLVLPIFTLVCVVTTNISVCGGNQSKCVWWRTQ